MRGLVTTLAQTSTSFEAFGDSQLQKLLPQKLIRVTSSPLPQKKMFYLCCTCW